MFTDKRDSSTTVLDILWSRLSAFKLPYWLPFPVIALAVLAVVAVYLVPAPREVPMGDAYIHFVYARNLAETGRFAFNSGIPEGIGTTSLLWVLLLAGLHKIGLDVVIAAKSLGTLALMGLGFVIYDITLHIIPERMGNARLALATIAALLAVMPGNLVWMALSGMETLLFTALAMLSLDLYLREKWLGLGFALGFLALTRIEGPLLAAVILLVEVLRQRKVRRETLLIVIPMVVLILPLVAYLQVREGFPLPTSYQGKRITTEAVQALIASEHPALGRLLGFTPLMYVSGWLGYVLLYMNGNVILPGPSIALESAVVGSVFFIPWAAIAVLGLVILPLCFASVRHLWRRRRTVLDRTHIRLLAVFLLWTLGHNLLYALVLPQPGAAGRYTPMNHIILWEAMFMGALLLGSRRLEALAGLFIAGLLGLSLVYWQGVYEANIEYMLKVRLPAARFVDEKLPPGTPIGAVDLGPLRYYSEQPVVDLLGFVNKEVVAYVDAGGSYSDYLAREEICYLLMFDTIDPSAGDWVQFARLMGLTDDPRLNLIPELVLAIPLDEWTYGNDAVRNYMPAIFVYRINWQDRPLCAGPP